MSCPWHSGDLDMKAVICPRRGTRESTTADTPRYMIGCRDYKLPNINRVGVGNDIFRAFSTEMVRSRSQREP